MQLLLCLPRKRDFPPVFLTLSCGAQNSTKVDCSASEYKFKGKSGEIRFYRGLVHIKSAAETAAILSPVDIQRSRLISRFRFEFWNRRCTSLVFRTTDAFMASSWRVVMARLGKVGLGPGRADSLPGRVEYGLTKILFFWPRAGRADPKIPLGRAEFRVGLSPTPSLLARRRRRRKEKKGWMEKVPNSLMRQRVGKSNVFFPVSRRKEVFCPITSRDI